MDHEIKRIFRQRRREQQIARERKTEVAENKNQNGVQLPPDPLAQLILIRAVGYGSEVLFGDYVIFTTTFM